MTVLMSGLSAQAQVSLLSPSHPLVVKQEKEIPILLDNKLYSHVTCCHQKSAIFAFLVSQKLHHHESLNTEKPTSNILIGKNPKYPN